MHILNFLNPAWPVPALDPSDVRSSLYPLGDCWCSLYQRTPVVEGESKNKDLSHNTNSSFIISAILSPSPSALQQYLLISGNSSIHSSIDDPIEAHAERVDVPMMLPVLVLANQSPQLLGLILHHVNSVLQRAHLHLEINTDIYSELWWKRGWPLNFNRKLAIR